jgi:hypothetical protein
LALLYIGRASQNARQVTHVSLISALDGLTLDFHGMDPGQSTLHPMHIYYMGLGYEFAEIWCLCRCLLEKIKDSTALTRVAPTSSTL